MAAKTPVFDWETGEFKIDLTGRVVTATGAEAVEQAAVKALQTARSLYLIYFDAEDPTRHNKYGSEVHDIAVRRDLSESVRIDELKRAVREALIYDPWITDVPEVTITRQGKDEIIIDITLATVFDQAVELRGVTLVNG